MDREAARRVHALFTRALSLEGAARQAFLETQCAGDDPLRARVQQLLRAAEASTGFLETPALSGVFEKTPDAVGTYLVTGVLGVGGMATVYEAVQENPNRRVALKVMHRELSHTDAYLRFRLETESLAKLHHPGIAQIYEAGTAPLGRDKPSPFFAMELVPEAQTITQYAHSARLTLRQRLEMFASVCDAVLHGHQHGIIHRDLKPGNVLIGPDGRPKVIDFGIARPLDSAARVTRDIDATRLVGTLNWMSPEQCSTPADVDVRTDVYSLGVVLFELVTGRLPWDLSRRSIAEAVRVISSEAAPAASSLRPEARGDLDAIIAKSMQKDRDRRYAGAGALAADVRRYLASEPVEARPVGPLTQLRMFARRNRALTVTTATAAVLLACGVVVSSLLAISASRARDDAEQRARELEVVTAVQETMLQELDVPQFGRELRTAMRERVATAFAGEAEQDTAIADFDRIIARVNFTTVASQSLAPELLTRYRAAIDARSGDTPRLRAQLLLSLAAAMTALGQQVEAEPVLREALAIRQREFGGGRDETFHAMHALGSVLSDIGKYDESLDLLVRAHSGRVAALGPEHPLALRTAVALGGVHRRSGNLAEAERVWRETLESQRRLLGGDHNDTIRTLSNLGIVHAMKGETDQAEACWREALERRTRISGADHPGAIMISGNLGVLLQDKGRPEEARPILERALAAERRRTGERNPATLSSMAQLASVLLDLGDLDAAEKLQRECWMGRNETLKPNHPDTLYAQAMLGYILHKRGDGTHGLSLLDASLGTQRRTMPPGHPQVTSTIAMAAEAALANAADRPGLERALALSAEAVDLARKGASTASLGTLLSQHGNALLQASLNTAGKEIATVDSAHAPLLEGFELLENSVGPEHPQTRTAAGRLARYFERLHALHPGQGHDAAAVLWRAKSSDQTAAGNGQASAAKPR